jgi:hypothetical protein
MDRKRRYEEEYEKVEMEREIAAFEARQGGKQTEIPALPIPPKVDYDVLRSFEPPSATRFFEYQSPTIVPVAVKTAKRPRPVTREMARGCPACNPDHHDAIRPRHPSPKRNGRCLHPERTPRRTPARDELPLQLNQAYWNVLDEPSVPARPPNVYVEVPKSKPFCKLGTGPRPSGIPVCRGDVIESRAHGQAWFDDQMARRDDRELYARERTLHKRVMTSRAFHSMLSDHTREIAEECEQEWRKIPAKRAASSRTETALEEKKRLAIRPDEEQAMAELRKYDDTMWEDYQAALKRPTEAIVEVLQETLKRKRRPTSEQK